VLTEAIFLLLRCQPSALLRFPAWLARGKRYFKARIAERVRIDPALLPYDGELLAWLRAERDRGRRIFLVTAAHERMAGPVAQHLELFDGVIASDASINLDGIRKARRLTETFGARGFDYAGNSRVDLPVWAAAGAALVVNAPGRVLARARLQGPVERVFARNRSLGDYLTALRIHRWLGNLLVFVPVLVAQQISDPARLGHTAVAFIAFSLCASGVGVLNDLLELMSDRRDPARRHQPFAAGRLPIQHGAVLSPVLVIASFAIGASLPAGFAATLALYLGLALAYALRLRRMAFIEVIVRVVLYTLRIIGGGVAAGITLSWQLLAVSMCALLGVALVRRELLLSP
jgi:phosphoserine phosphatase